jgi:hypothetical protein
MQNHKTGLEIVHGSVSGHPLPHDQSDCSDQFHALHLQSGEFRDFDGAGMIDRVLNLPLVRAVPRGEQHPGGTPRGGKPQSRTSVEDGLHGLYIDKESEESSGCADFFQKKLKSPSEISTSISPLRNKKVQTGRHEAVNH